MWHEISYIWLTYFWGSDKGNAGESAQEWALGALVVSLLYPPIRHAFKREFEKIHHKLDHALNGGTLDTYVEPEWDRFEHWVVTLCKWIIKPFRKKVA